jgi:HK97 family phage prohead protease
MTQAQEQRAALAEKHEMPTDGARMVPFRAVLRAEQVDWNGAQRYQLDGIASTTEQPYRMFDAFGEYDEVIDRAAFNETLSRDPDVAFLVNHKGVTMARSRPNGRGFRSLELSVGATGLQSRAYVNPERQDVKDLVHAIRDSDITEMSFAFRIDDGDWNDDFTNFRIRKVDLDRGDVSAVNYGANPYTSIAARSAELLRDLDRLPAGAARAALERLQARRELQPAVIDLGARRSAEPAPSNGSGEVAPVLAPSPLLPPSETARGATFTIAGDRWYQVKPDAQIFARAGDSDELVSLGWVDDVEQLDVISGGPARVRTTPLPPSSLLPPVQGLSNDQRSDLGRSVRLVRTEWMIEDEDD